MMRSMYSGVAALRAHQTKMDVTANNVANVNTVGYKKSTVTFADAFSQTLSGASSSSTTGRGGTNPQQIGLGANLAAITVDHTKGATQTTNAPTDLMIDGDGYFVLSPDSTGLQKYYSRAGNFVVDELGYLVSSSNGYKVLNKDFEPIRIDKSATTKAEATTHIKLSGNLNFNEEPDSATNIAYSTTVDLYDTVGNKNTLKLDFGKKYATPPGATSANTFTFRMVRFEKAVVNGTANEDYGTVTPLAVPTAGNTTTATNAGVNSDPIFAKFDNEGNFVELVGGITIDENEYVTATGTALDSTASPSELLLTKLTAGSDDIVVDLAADTTNGIKAAFADLKHTAQSTDLAATTVDGNAAGVLNSFNISQNGEVVATFTNGNQEVIATIGLAKFDNPSGLLKNGGNLFTETMNSGEAKYGQPAAGSFGSITAGALEMSNVDLSAEFTDMITTQRGFQANSRIITTSDEILQELVNLKR